MDDNWLFGIFFVILSAICIASSTTDTFSGNPVVGVCVLAGGIICGFFAVGMFMKSAVDYYVELQYKQNKQQQKTNEPSAKKG